MENQIISDTEIKSIKENDSKVRIVGKVTSFDEKTGIFEVSDEESKMTCMSGTNEINVKPSDLVLVTGRAIVADSSFEIRAEAVETIDINEYNNYKKYLKIRNNLLTK